MRAVAHISAAVHPFQPLHTQAAMQQKQEALKLKRAQLTARKQAHSTNKRKSIRRFRGADARRSLAGRPNGSTKRRSTVVHTPAHGGGIMEMLIGHAKDGAWKDGAFRETRLQSVRNAVEGGMDSDSDTEDDWDDDI